MQQPQPTDPPQQSPPPTNSFLRYSSMTAQMGIPIGLAVWGGIKLDQKFPNRYHAWTLILSICGVGLAMYSVIRSLIKTK